MIKISFFCILLAFFNSIAAQVPLVKGFVLSNQDAHGVPGATISIREQNKIVTSDRNGHFEIAGINLGTYEIIVTAIGFEKYKDSFSIKDSSDSLVIQLTHSTNTLNEVVVSGTMRPVSKMASPIPVEVYSSAFFKKNPAPNIFESLQMVNGIQPQLNCNVCNTGDIHINGMEGPYTMILIDGMPIVSSLSTVYGLAGIPNSMVKRIEVVKGPASTLYGSEAVGGLVNIITKDAFSSEKLKIDFSVTSIGEYNADIHTKINTKKAVGLLGINYFNFQNKKDVNSDNFTDLTLQNRLSVFNKWNFKRAGLLNASIALRYINESRWGGELQWASQFKGTDSVYGESINTNRVEAIGNIELAKQLNLDISYNYHLQDSYYGTVKYYANQQVAFAQLRWDKSIGNHNLLMGLPLRYTYYDDNTPATQKPGKNNPTHAYLPGIFLQDEWEINNHFTTLMGLRYDYHNEHGSIFTPRLSFKYSPDANNTLRLSFGNGYRVVNLFTEDHAALTGARTVVISEALKPEQSWNTNINYTKFIKHKAGFIGIDASAFYTYFTNKIIGDFLADPNKIIYANLNGYAISRGITLNTDFNFTNGIKIIAGATWMDVYQMDKNMYGNKIKTPQLFAPKISGTFAVSYTFPKNNISIDFTGKINGPMYLPVVPNDFRPDKSPLYGILNFQTTKSCKAGIEIYFGIKNLLNFLPKNPLLHPDDPFNKAGGKYFDSNGNPRPDTNPNGYVFDPSYNYASIQGAKGFIGVRWSIK
jgi:outer membrane receptor for ferrienterochelin and colicins